MSYQDLTNQVQNLVNTNATLVTEVTRVRDAAMGMFRLYPTISDGRTDSNIGQYFSVPGDGAFLRLYKKTSTSQQTLIEEYPTLDAFNNAIAQTNNEANRAESEADRAQSISDNIPVVYDVESRTSVQPTISSDFERNRHQLYEQYGNEPKTITQMWDGMARGTTATYVDATGKSILAGVNEPLIDYTTGRARLATKQEKTYYILHSENWLTGEYFNGWSMSSGFFRQMVAGDHPEMDTGAQVCHFGPNTGNHSFNNSINHQILSIPAGGVYTAVADYKAIGDTDTVRFLHLADDGGTVGGVLNLFGSGGVRGGNFVASADITEQLYLDSLPLGNGWYRCIVTFRALAGVPVFRFRAFPHIGTSALTGDGTSGLHGTKAMLVNGSYVPGEYVKTENTALTRAADHIERSVGGRLNQNEGGLLIKLDGEVVPRNESDFGRIFNIGDGTPDNRVYAIRRMNNTYTFYIFCGGVQQNAFTSLSLGSIKNILFVWSKANDLCEVYVDGVLRSSGTFSGFTAPLTALSLGSSSGGQTPIQAAGFSGVKAFPKLLPQAERIQLTKV